MSHRDPITARWLMLLAVIVTLFDRFQPFREARFPREAVEN